MISKQSSFIWLTVCAILPVISSTPVLFSDFTCTQCPGSATGADCSRSYTSNDLPGYSTSGSSTVGVWAKFSTPMTDMNINIFVLGRKSTLFPGHLMSYFRYKSLYLVQGAAFYNSMSDQTETSDSSTSAKSQRSFSFSLNRWYFFYYSIDFPNGQNKSSHFYGIYDPASHILPENWIKFSESRIWNGFIDFGSDVMLSFGVFDSQYMQSFPCVSFAGAYAITKYIPDNNAVFQSFGQYQPRIFLLYVFDSQDIDTILDRSGNAINGVLGSIDTDGTIDTTVAPGWDASDAAYQSSGPVFTGNQVIVSRPFPVSLIKNAPQIIGIHMNFKITTSSADQCDRDITSYYTLFQLLLNSGANPGAIFLVGISYETTTVFQVFLKDSAGNTKLFEPRFNSEGWTTIDMFCGEHNRTGQAKMVCSFYFDPPKSYASVVTILPDVIDSKSILSIKLGSEQNSFCGSVNKFLAFSNTTYYQTLSFPSPCSLAIGLVSPTCLESETGNISCGAEEYFDSENENCEDCPSGCLSCTSSTNCLTCHSGFALTNQSICEPASSGNATNTTNNTNTTNETNASNGTNTTNNTNTTEPLCPSHCRNCSSTTFCYECHDGYNIFEGTCYKKSCNAGYYFNELSEQCESCDSSCESCFGPLNTNCKSCKYPRVYFKQQCLVNCPPNSTYNLKEGKCVDCDPTCLSCSPTGCALCPDGKFLFQNMCLYTCPGGYYEKISPTLPGPTCIPKSSSEMSVQLTTSPNQFLITLTNSSKQLLGLMSNRLAVTVGQRVLDQANYTTMVKDESTIVLTLYLENYVPKDTILTVKLNLPLGFNKDPSQEVNFTITSATIPMRETAFLSNSSVQTIEGVSVASNSLSDSLSVVQSMNFMKSAGVSTSVMRLQFSIQTFQMSRLIEAHYPPLIRKYFETADLNPPMLSSGFFSSLSSSPSEATSSSSTNGSTHQRLLIVSSNTSNTSEAQIDSTMAKEIFIQLFDAQLSIGIVILFAGIILHSLATFLFSKSSNKEGSSSSGWKSRLFIILKFADWLFNFNLTIVYFSFIQFTGVYYSITEIANSMKRIRNPLSLAVSVMYLAFNLLMIVFTYNRAANIKTTTPSPKRKRNYQTSPKSSKKLSPRMAFITAEYKTNNRLQTLYVPFMLTRIFLTALFLALLTNLPCLQATLILAINAGFLLYSIFLRPLLNRFIMALTIVTEILVTTGSICTLILTVVSSTEETLGGRNITGIVFICCSVGVSITGLIISFVQIVNTIINFKKYCQKKSSTPSFLSKLWQTLEQEYQKYEEGQAINYEEVEENKKITGGKECTEFTVENTWSLWRKSVAVISQEEWTKPENLEKLHEMINWARDLMPSSQRSQEKQHVSIDGLGFEILKQLNDHNHSTAE